MDINTEIDDQKLDVDVELEEQKDDVNREIITEIVDEPLPNNPIFVDRDKYVGGSEFAAVLGASKY